MVEVAKIMVVGEDGPAGVALGIAAECHRQNAVMMKGEERTAAVKAYQAITGEEPGKRVVSQQPEYGK